jgi:NACalpha-BTF3-like transcription factor
LFQQNVCIHPCSSSCNIFSALTRIRHRRCVQVKERAACTPLFFTSADAIPASIASAAAVTSEDLPMHKFRLPKRLTSLASSLLGPLFGYPPSPVVAQTSQQQRQLNEQRHADFEQPNMSDQERAAMEAQLEAFLRQQLDGGGLRGRSPRQSQPQPQQQPQPQPEDIARVMDFSGCDRQSAVDALQNNGGDVEAAVNQLLQ